MGKDVKFKNKIKLEKKKKREREKKKKNTFSKRTYDPHLKDTLGNFTVFFYQVSICLLVLKQVPWFSLKNHPLVSLQQCSGA